MGWGCTSVFQNKVINSNLVTDSIDFLEVGALSFSFLKIFSWPFSRKIFYIMPGLSNHSVRIRDVTQCDTYTVHIKFCRTDHFRHSFMPRTSRLWNGFDSSVLLNRFI